MNIILKKVPVPKLDNSGEPILINDETIQLRKRKSFKFNA